MYFRSIHASQLQTQALHPERTLRYQTVAEHDEAWPETKPPKRRLTLMPISASVGKLSW
ncbi:MAG: hypothetical protein WCK66_08410 [Betaproteobacteria bacterium]